MTDPRILGALEAILMVVDHPVPASALAEAVGTSEAECENALAELQDEYAGLGPAARTCGFELKNVAGGWRVYSRPEYADAVGRFVVGNEEASLSQAALETLAIVAYRQPVSRLQVGQIRGVNVDTVMRGLQARGLIVESGVTSTGAYLYETTPYFLECMGFETLGELVPLAPLLPDVAGAEEEADLTAD